MMVVTLRFAAITACLSLVVLVAGKMRNDNNAPGELHFHWFAPFLSGGGYCSEAAGFAEALAERVPRLKISQHGDTPNEAFIKGMPKKLLKRLERLRDTKVDPDRLVAVCHAEPGAWNVGDGAKYQTTPCPPLEEPLYTIGRTMFETNRIPLDWADRCNAMDEVWVPTEFHRGTFEAAGVMPNKLSVVPEPVDVVRFDPNRKGLARAPDLHAVTWLKGRVLGGGAAGYASAAAAPPGTVEQVRFLSIFKWEARKGWDILLEAFATEFSAVDRVSLTLITNPFHSNEDLVAEVERFVAKHAAAAGQRTLPEIIVVDSHIPESKMPQLYRSHDCFVLPSRGEGWGRPHVEAMSMGLPVIATNWSGPTAYLTEHNSYPLSIDNLVTVSTGAFRKYHKWAQPSLSQLRSLMRHVVDNPEDARLKGRNAREDMVTKFSPDKVADVVIARLWQIHDKLVENGEL